MVASRMYASDNGDLHILSNLQHTIINSTDVFFLAIRITELKTKEKHEGHLRFIKENDVELTNFLDSSVIEIFKKCYLYYEEIDEVYYTNSPQAKSILNFISEMCL